MVVTWKATGGVLFRSSFLFHSTLPHNTLTQTLSSFSLRFRGRAKLTSSLTVSRVSAFIRFTQVSKNCSLYLSLTLIIAFRRSIVFSVSQNSFNRSITAFAVLSEKGYCNVRDLFSTPPLFCMLHHLYDRAFPGFRNGFPGNVPSLVTHY